MMSLAHIFVKRLPFWFVFLVHWNPEATGFPQKLALGLSVGKGLLRQVNFTTFIRLWSYQWGHGLIYGVGTNTHYAVKMPNLYIFKYIYMSERCNRNEYCSPHRECF